MKVFKVGDPVKHATKNWKGTVTEVNDYYGWFKVKWTDSINHVTEYGFSKGNRACYLDTDVYNESDNRPTG
jgi:hypothetical protein